MNKIAFSLTGFHLKYIALLTMAIDHFGAVLVPYDSPWYLLCRGIGRIAFPIYCFLLAEGYLHTSNQKAYGFRLLLFAFLSEIPFDMAFFHFPKNRSLSLLFSHQNVFFTLAFAFLAMYLLDCYLQQGQPSYMIGLAAVALMAEFFHFDYGLTGIVVVILFFVCKKYRPAISRLLAAFLALLPLFSLSITGLCVFLALPFLLLYNGEKGAPLPGGKTHPFAKYFFYLFYPAHLLILSILWFIK